MTTEAFEQFRTQISADKDLQASIAACFSSPPTDGSTGLDKLIALGKSHGFDFTAQDVQACLRTGNAALSDAELDQVSAGGVTEILIKFLEKAAEDIANGITGGPRFR